MHEEIDLHLVNVFERFCKNIWIDACKFSYPWELLDEMLITLVHN